MRAARVILLLPSRPAVAPDSFRTLNADILPGVRIPSRRAA
jgi:hypothetical protein